MTPFIVWLSRNEIDEVLLTLINSKSADLGKILSTDELLDLTRKLSEQNSKLIKLIEKIEPLNPLNKKVAHIHGIEEKCKHFHSELESMSLHCLIHNDKFTEKHKEFSESICKDCPNKKGSDLPS